MHDLFIAMLDLCTRPGELLKVQVKHVDLKAKEVDLAWRSTKTRRGRVLPLYGCLPFWKCVCSVQTANRVTLMSLSSGMRPVNS